MSVAAPPPPAPVQVGPLTVGPPREVNLQEKHQPMRGLPSISKTMTTAEAQAKRQTWLPPNIIPGEFVFYREAGKNDECIGWVVATTNKTYKLTVMKANYTGSERNSVAYYDHTLDDPAAVGDPMAPWNSNGTFRRTEFGTNMANLIQQLRTQVPSNQLASDLLAQQQQLIELRDQLKVLQEAITPRSPAPTQQAQPKK